MLQNIATEYHEDARELRGLFEKQLKELYWSEKAMIQMLPDVIKAITSADLTYLLESRIAQALGQVTRIEKIFGSIGLQPESIAYESVKCLLKETKETISSIKKGVVRDAALISILQKIKHYEIACYGTMRAFAIALREESVVTLLENTLIEEKAADQALSSVAESHINIEAADKEI